MKSLKALKILVLVVIVSVFTLFLASVIFQEKLSALIVETLNRSLPVKIGISSSRISFLKNFPNGSIELNNVVVHSSPGFDTRSFPGVSTDTLLFADKAAVEFSLIRLLKKEYHFKRIRAENGKLNLLTDQQGLINYELSDKNDPGTNETIFDLERIILENMSGYYNNRKLDLIISGQIGNGKIKTRISGRDIYFKAKGEADISDFRLSGTAIRKPVKAEFDIDLESSLSGVVFNKSGIALDGNEISFRGSISSNDLIDMYISGNKVNLSKLAYILPPEFMKDYSPSGIMKAECKIKGLFTKSKYPHFDLNYAIKDGQIRNNDTEKVLKNISCSGYFTNGKENNKKTAALALTDARLTLGITECSGSGEIAGFDHPRISLTAKGRVYPQDVIDFFNMKDYSATGSLMMELKLDSSFWPSEDTFVKQVLILKPKAELVFDAVSISSVNNFTIKNINGSLLSNDVVTSDNLSFNYNNLNFIVSGSFRKLHEWLAGKKVVLEANATVRTDRLVPELIFNDKTGPSSVPISDQALRMPSDIILDLRFNADSLIHKSFSSSEVKGSLIYKTRLLTFNQLEMKTLRGQVSGKGFVKQNSDKEMIVHGKFDISGIDINRTFRTFHNFGQEFIKSENLSGLLSGTLSVMIPMDSLLNPKIKAVSAEGNYVLTNGALINFDPVKELSSFIEVSELNNIVFDKIENDFFIRNNYFYTPQMDVKSSAADITVNGKHSFDNNYEYHVKVLLSEILSRKRKKNRNKISEFGVVEDDGLGRTSLLLKVENKGDEVKVGYDLRAAAEQVKSNIRTEKQSLKAIMNEEYGWFRNDSLPKQDQQPEKKKRFNITWDDSPAATSGDNQ